jgi:hypothetical protein
MPQLLLRNHTPVIAHKFVTSNIQSFKAVMNKKGNQAKNGTYASYIFEAAQEMSFGVRFETEKSRTDWLVSHMDNILGVALERFNEACVFNSQTSIRH